MAVCSPIIVEAGALHMSFEAQPMWGGIWRQYSGCEVDRVEGDILVWP